MNQMDKLIAGVGATAALVVLFGVSSGRESDCHRYNS
jgi:hypothetical protein